MRISKIPEMIMAAISASSGSPRCPGIPKFYRSQNHRDLLGEEELSIVEISFRSV